jgi:hypothetical protein
MSACLEYMLSMQRTLRSMQFLPVDQDACGPVKSEGIVIRKPLMSTKPGEGALPHVITPGLVITAPKTISAPAELGTNERDDIWYPILVQIVDTDGQERLKGMASYLEWAQKIRKAFHCHSFTDIPVEIGCGHSYATQIDVVDEKRWTKEMKWITGVVVAVRSRETRGIEL